MYLPEYTITNQTLKNIASIEYAKAIIETTTILPNWQSQLQNEATARTLTYSLYSSGFNVSFETIKKLTNNLPTKVSLETTKYYKAMQKMNEFAQTKQFDEKEIKELHKITTGKSSYRSKKIESAVNPQEILAEVVELLDWYNSLDARETHPIVAAAIFRAKLEHIKPFGQEVTHTLNLVTALCLKTNGYTIRNFYSLEEFYYQTTKEYNANILDAIQNDDLTQWITYFTDGFNREISNVAEKVKILAKDTKLAKVSGRVHLTDRQERIVTYLQDYGIIQNKDFAKLFPSISEDSVLRDLKKLVASEIVVKKGKTKSSRYELR